MDDRPEGIPAPDVPSTGTPETAGPAARLSARLVTALLAAASGVFFIDTFLPWYRVRLTELSTSKSASGTFNLWHSGTQGKVLGFLGMAVFFLVASELLGVRFLKSPRGQDGLALTLAAVAVLLAVLRLASIPIQSGQVQGLEFRTTRGLGAWLGVPLTLAMAAAAFQKWRATAAA